MATTGRTGSERQRERSLLWPAIGTVVFTILFPGTVVVLVPYWLSRWEMRPPLLGIGPFRWLGAALIVAGLPLMLDFLARFVREGRGTPAPIAPPQHLVVRGVFHYVRNPGYVAVVGIIVGQALFLGNATVLAYAAIVALCFHLFVVGFEEPDLRRRFGSAYEAYCREVPRWLPRPARRRA